MPQHSSLRRFIEAQAASYASALAEINSGRKRSHWMWYIFPQIQGLGLSETARFYAVTDLREAEEYARHPVLGRRLVEISTALLGLKSSDAHAIFGSPDDAKLKSSMTLFAAVPGADPVFRAVLENFLAASPTKIPCASLVGPNSFRPGPSGLFLLAVRPAQHPHRAVAYH